MKLHELRTTKTGTATFGCMWKKGEIPPESIEKTFYRAKNEGELAKIYDTINELEKTSFSAATDIHRTDAYQPLLWLALGFLLAGLILEKLFLIKVP